MKKQLVVRAKKQLVVRRPILIIKAICGKFKGQQVQLLKRGFSGWHGKLVKSEDPVYLFSEEVP